MLEKLLSHKDYQNAALVIDRLPNDQVEAVMTMRPSRFRFCKVNINEAIANTAISEALTRKRSSHVEQISDVTNTSDHRR